MGSVYCFFYKIISRGPETFFERALFSLFGVCGFLYGFAMLLRSFLYQKKILSSYRAPVPVISVGNLAAGGTGKTPVVDYISRLLLSKGVKTAVVSRGYGRQKIRDMRLVCAGEGALVSPELGGDEPFLLATRNPGLVVIAAVKRKDGVAFAVEDHGAEVVILDDGFQHLAVQRDLNIVLLDADRPFGNGRVLPGGILREFPSALRRGNLFLLTRASEQGRFDVEMPGEVLTCRHVMAFSFFTLAGDRVDVAGLKGLRGGGFTGIATPGKFFSDLVNLGLNIEKTEVFRDHVNYGEREVDRLGELARGVDYLVTTEKDAVKLRQKDLPLNCYIAPLDLEFSEPGKLEAILDSLL